jgi:hypothetical protein
LGPLWRAGRFRFYIYSQPSAILLLNVRFSRRLADSARLSFADFLVLPPVRHPMFAILASLLEAVGGTATLWKGMRHAVRYARSASIPGTERAHRQELRRRLNTLPFIYRDLEGTLESNYVNSAYRPQSLLTLDRAAPQPRAAGERFGTRERAALDEVAAKDRRRASSLLRGNNRAIFLGNAGIGKTTFLSRLTLSLTDAADAATRTQFFHAGMKLFPIFVPLKVLDNSAPHPIFTYISTSYSYFRGPRGLRRMLRLAAANRLLLVLDGYDEIYNSGSRESFVASDIEAVFRGGVVRSTSDHTNEDVIRFYGKMGRNVVWLTSRKDYYVANRLACEMDDTWRGKETIACVELMGIVNRADLVTRIFDRYRTKFTIHQDFLSEDAFFAYVHRTFDEEMITLTYNPLFLTMMCFVYARHLEDNEGVAPSGIGTVRQIILKCVQLLLTDLDAYKVRGLPPRTKHALDEKRGLYPDEKFEFLGYFAARLEADAGRVRRTFTRTEIVEAAHLFFSARGDLEATREIVRGLWQDGTSSIVNQLINQELFVTVTVDDAPLYDFPHRRFREVLASTYLDDPTRTREILENLHNPDQRELLIVLFAVTESQADRLLEAILSRAGDPRSERYFVSLAAACIRARGSEYDASAILQGWLKNSINTAQLHAVPAEVLPHLHPSEAFLSWLHAHMAHAMNAVNHDRAELDAAVLYHLSPAGFLDLLLQELESARGRAMMLLGVLLSTDPDALARLMETQAANPAHVRQIGSAAVFGKGVTGRERWWRRMCAALPMSEVAHLMLIAESFAPHLAPRLLGFEDLTRLESTPPPESEGVDHVYLFTHWNLDELEVQRGQRALRAVKEGIYFDASFIPPLELPSWEEAERRLDRPGLKKMIAGEKDPAKAAELSAWVEDMIARIHNEETERTHAFVRTQMARKRDDWLDFLQVWSTR